MNVYRPNRWVIVKVKYKDEIMYRVLGGWSGGYLDGDSWRLGSPIVNYQFETDEENESSEYIRFFNESGSEYLCHATGEGFNMIMSEMYSLIEEHNDVSVETLSWEDILKHELLENKNTGEA